MNDYKKIFVLITLLLITVAIALNLLLTGCVTNRRTDRTVIEYQKQIDRLESTIEQYDTAMRNSAERLRDITTRSVTMEGTVDEIIGLFDEYQHGVDQLIRDYNTVRTAYKNINQDTDNTY
mgnify:CR=1 FL=1